jgi:hypothetical protein
MIHQQPTTASGVPPTAGRERGDPDLQFGLTRAEARALRRCAPLTRAQFKDRGRLAERGVAPLRQL